MGVHEGCAQPDGFCPNGLLPNEGMLVAGLLDMERWSRAEDRAAELIACIQPNRASEECRNAVTCYVQRLIMQCFSCQVITFGSVPLKTYLPDGDIDLTAFSTDQNLSDTWANKVRNMLESEEKSLDAEFCVKEVQYIQAEVKIVKCLIENIVVDISFNQLGGLCTLCFLEEVDHLINQSHLFKRSIILIKAWCHYESRILGAHHGLISTYALETLVLYIFHVFNNSFSGPLEVLYYFMEFFSKFDWDNFCVSLYGPVPVNQLPDITAAPPRKDGGELLLSKLFLHACSSVYAVYPCGREHQDHPFISKHFNVIDPLRTNNNLGRSVSKGNLFRIRSAFAFGAQQLARLLGCPRPNVVSEVDHFFLNTWDRHRKSHRPDVPRPGPYVLQPVNLNHTDGSYNLKNYSTIKRAKEGSTSYESKFGKPPYSASHAVSLQHDSTSLRPTSVIDTVSAVSRAQETSANLTRLKSFDQNYPIVQRTHSNKHTTIGKGTSCTSECPWNIQAQYHFIRMHCPDLAVAKTRNPSRGRHSQRTENQNASEMTYNSRQGNFKSKILETHVGASLDEDPPSSGHPFLASSGHSHKKSAGMVPLNISPLQSSWELNVHYSKDLVSFPVCHYVYEAGMASNQDEIVEAAGDSLESAEMNQKDSNHCLLAEGASSSIRRSDTSGGSSGAEWQDEKQWFTSPGNHPSVKENEEFMRENNDGNHKSVKENKELMRENYSDDCSDQNITRNATYSTAHLKIPPSSKSTLSRSREYSESSWGVSITEVSKLKKDGQGSQLHFSMDPYIVYGLDKSGRLYEGRLPGHVTRQGADDNRNWIPLSTVATKVAQHIVSSHSEANQKLGRQPAHLGVINSSQNHFRPETLNNYNPVKRDVYVEPCEQHKSDILNSDYASHWNNLQYGRLSQSSQHLGHFMYSSCVDLLPMYSECHFPWHGTGRPPDNADLFYQHMDDCSHFVPESTLEPVSIRPTDIYQHYGDDIPRHHGETGTYLPNPKPDKDRQSSKTRSHRMTHGYDWKDRHGDSKGNWNPNSKARHLGRGQRCSLEEWPHTRLGWITKRNSHSWRADSFEDTSSPLYISQDGLFSSLYSVRCSSGSETHGLHPPPTASSDMLYSHEQKISYRSSSQQLEFGCLGPVDFSGTNGKLHLGESSFQGGTMNF